METTYDRKGITSVIEKAHRNAADGEKFTVIIKPTDDAAYSDFVNVLDEMEVTKTEHYGVTDIKDWEVPVYKNKVDKPASPSSN